jgi:putative PIN family toxin of toxin-antitoxin system
MNRAVLDSNVYISALLFGGIPRAVVELAQLGEFESFVSAPLIQEIEEVLKKKFLWPDSMIRRAAVKTWRAAHIIKTESEVDECVDPGDNRVLECALTAQADFIVTGDRHLLHLHPYRDIQILNPRQFLDADARRSRLPL